MFNGKEVSADVLACVLLNKDKDPTLKVMLRDVEFEVNDDKVNVRYRGVTQVCKITDYLVVDWNTLFIISWDFFKKNFSPVKKVKSRLDAIREMGTEELLSFLSSIYSKGVCDTIFDVTVNGINNDAENDVTRGNFSIEKHLECAYSDIKEDPVEVGFNIDKDWLLADVNKDSTLMRDFYNAVTKHI